LVSSRSFCTFVSSFTGADPFVVPGRGGPAGLPTDTGNTVTVPDDLFVPELGLGPLVAMAVTRPLLMLVLGLAVVAPTVFGDRSDAIARAS
jgi:hypothetical protein